MTWLNFCVCPAEARKTSSKSNKIIGIFSANGGGEGGVNIYNGYGG